jgi:hypothetical protein
VVSTPLVGGYFFVKISEANIMTKQQQPIEVHSFPTPNGKKITVMLEELEVPYTICPRIPRTFS